MPEEKGKQQFAVEFPNPNPEQLFVMERFSKAVGSILTLVEAVMPDGQQCVAFKKSCETVMYSLRNDLLRKFK